MVQQKGKDLCFTVKNVSYLPFIVHSIAGMQELLYALKFDSLPFKIISFYGSFSLFFSIWEPKTLSWANIFSVYLLHDFR